MSRPAPAPTASRPWRTLAQEFAIPPAQARRDVAEFLRRLRSFDLVESRAQ